MADEAQQVEKKEMQTGVTRIGIGQLNNATPMWVNWIFRVEFILNKALLMLLSTSSIFTPEQVKESLVWIAVIDFTFWAVGRFIGISKDQMEDK